MSSKLLSTCQLVIKTSSQKDHEELQSIKSLPKAFQSGIELIEKIKKFHAAIHHIDTDIDLNKTEYKTVRENHGIIEIKRLTTRTGDSLKPSKLLSRIRLNSQISYLKVKFKYSDA